MTMANLGQPRDPCTTRPEGLGYRAVHPALRRVQDSEPNVVNCPTWCTGKVIGSLRQRIAWPPNQKSTCATYSLVSGIGFLLDERVRKNKQRN